MRRSLDETRRDFLMRLTRTAAFVPPAPLTLDVSRAAAQGGGKGSSGHTTTSSAIRSLTPTSSQAIEHQFQLNSESRGTLPWPWHRARSRLPRSQPPATSSGE